MKKITFLFILILTLLTTVNSFGQIVAVVGISHDSAEGFTFVATQDITASTTIRFTDNEYDAAANVFTFNGAPTGEFVATWVATAAVTKGTVFYVKEVSANTLTITCSSGTCGTITWSTNTGVGNGAFSFASSGDSLYAYQDTNDDPRDAIGEIYAVMYTINGNIPANESPLSDWPNAIVTDGFSFPVSGADRTEYGFSPASLRDGKTKADLENPGNYVNGPSTTDMSVVPFTNFNLVGVDPILTVAVSPTSVNENSGTGMVYTFTLDAPAVGVITANFNVSGTGTFTTDYTQSGAASFNASSGTVNIPNAATTATVTLTPVGDTTLEPDETAILTLAAGTGYTAGSPNSATGTILNDDTLAVTPVVAVTGGVHTIGMVEGFSFVALDDITAGTEVFFTENVFDNNLLRFTGAEAVVRWTAPGGGVLRGEVIVATEGPANVFTTTCNSGTCGTVTLISGVFDFASNGEALFAYTDSDTDHTNGITAISAVLFTGTSTTPGGNIPTGEDPSGVYVGSVVVDGFPAVPPVRTEYRFALGERAITVDQANFQNTANWLHGAAVATLDPTPFANIIIATGSANPNLTLTVAPSSSVEDSGVGMVYTFLLDAPAVGNITVNFTVAGTATFTTDYTQTGAATFAAASGTAVILNGNTSVDVTVTPVVDVIVEPLETVELMIASGTGYDGGSPNAATGSITNDDTSNSDPLVAITGMNHVTPDGFSFVAAKDIPAGTTIYFTENVFDNTTLLFGTGEGVFAYTSPGAVIPAGDVIVIKETAPNVFSLTCNGNTGAPCGSFVLVSGNLAHDTLGESLYAYEDSDTDPSNGVDDIYAVMFTGLSSASGGSIPASQDPSGIYLSALVIDGFPATAPSRTEYRFALGERGIPVGVADFENTAANWLHGQANADLSPIPFANIAIVDVTPPVITCPADATVECGGDTTPTGTGTATATDDIDPTPTITFVDTSVAGCGLTEVITRTWTATDDAGNSSSCVQTITVVDTTDPAITCPANATVECGGDTTPAGTGTATGTDGCGTVTITFADSSVAGCGLTEVITRTWTATDECGNTATCVQTITVVDTTDPVVTCPADATVECGNDTSPANTGTATGTDGCGTVTITFADSSAANCGLTETITRTWTATDECGNTAICVQTITVVDTTLPTITCPANITVSNTAGTCGAIVTYTAPVGSDTCGTSTTIQIAGLGSGATFPVGSTTETYEVTDACGNVETCSFVVTVNDTEDPIVTCPADITVSNDAGLCSAVVTYTVTSSDNCPGETVVQTLGLASGSTFPIGTTTNTFVVTDASGNTATCSFDVTVNDTEDPVITCPADITVSNDAGLCSAVVTYAVTSSDNCPGETVVQTLGLASGSTFPLGTTTNTFVVTDASGNTATCSFDVTVNDTEDPVITCPADITVSNDAGLCSAVVTYAVTSSDNCPGETVVQTLGLASGSTFPIGTTTNTFVVTDASGNTATCSFDVTVNDNEDPVITCPADIIVSNDAGVCGAAVSYVVTTSDNCPGETVVQTLGLASGSTFPIGTTTNTFVVTDASGNTATCSFDVTVNDTEPPVVTCPADITVSNDPGQCDAIVTFMASATDNCPGVTTSSVPASGSVFPVGTTTVTVTATDASGNTDTCTFDVTVNDTEDPVIICPADITVSNDVGLCSAVVTYATPLGTDNCPGATTVQTLGLASGSTFPLGTTTNTFVVTDAAGNTATCSFDVTVNDNEDPIIACPADFVVSNDAGVCGAVINYAVGFGDNCPGATLVQTAGQASGTVFPIGTTTNTFVVTDTSGNTATCSFDVTVNDTEPPVVTCPADIIVSNDAGVCGATVTYVVTTSDNCPGETVVQTVGQASGTVFPIGTTTNTFVVTDASGNTATCSFDVTVNDTEPPVITCPADITVSNDPGLCSAVVTYVVTTSDNCPGETIAQTAGLASGSIFPVGTTTNTFVVTDTSGNTATCSFDVTVDDTEPPVAICAVGPPLDVSEAGVPLGQPIPASGTSGPMDPSVATVTDSGILGVDYDIDTVELDLNHTFDGDLDISLTSPMGTVLQLSNDNGGFGDNYVGTLFQDGGANINAGSAPFTGVFEPEGGTFAAAFGGENINGPWTLNIQDNFAGDSGQLINFRMNFTDLNAGPIVVILDGTGNATITVADIDAGSTDNCGIASTSIDITSFTCADIGINIVTLTVTDIHGNVSTCTSEVLVVDDQPPVAVCQDITVQLDANGMVSIVPADIDGGSTDNCAITLMASQTDFTCADVGPNVVTLTVTDEGGNVSTCTAIVTVEDNVPPVAVCLNIDVFLDANGEASITPVDVDGGSTDACGIASLAIDITDFTCADIGPNNVTLTVTDVNGNVSTCIAVVMVIDDIPPTISCPADIFTSTDPDICGAIVVFPDPLALDNCAVTVAHTGGLFSGDVFPVGVNTVEFTATDEGGNMTVCTFTITVEDLTPPVAVCQDITIQLDANGDATITAADVDGGSFDNCGVITGISIDIDTFDCSDLGDNPVVLSVTDDNGNVGTCTAIVTVEDVTAPVALCVDITVQLDAAGTVTIVATDVDGGSTDACGIDTLSIDIDTFTCDDVGGNPVVLTVTDASGNSSSCTAIVTVEDVTGPVVTCMDIEVGLDQDGLATIVPGDVLVSATDACGVGTAALDIFEFSCDDIGTPVTVQVFVTDINGNVSSCTAVVTVKDGIDPILTCPADFTVEVDEGTSYTVPDFIADGTVTVTDNCTDPVTNTTQDPAPGTILPEGVYTVTMTAEDDSSNGATCTFELTVLGVLGFGDTFDISTIVMYPNPATTEVFISNPQQIELKEALIFDLVGRIVGTYNLQDMGTDISLDISYLATATYTVIIKGQDGQIVKQLIKE